MELVIGADPEFLLADRERLIPAADFFGKHGKVGTDGHNFTGELRPDPGRTPEECMANLHVLIDSLAHSVSGNNVIGGCYPEDMTGKAEPLGGHIHFCEEAPRWTEQWVKEAIITFLGIPTMIMEGEQGYVRRMASSLYGQLNNFRDPRSKNPNAHGGYEYRSPGSWISDPAMARWVFSVAHMLQESLVAENVPKIPWISEVNELVGAREWRPTRYTKFLPRIIALFPKFKNWDNYAPVVGGYIGHIKRKGSYRQEYDVADMWLSGKAVSVYPPLRTVFGGRVFTCGTGVLISPIASMANRFVHEIAREEGWDIPTYISYPIEVHPSTSREKISSQDITQGAVNKLLASVPAMGDIVYPSYEGRGTGIFIPRWMRDDLACESIAEALAVIGLYYIRRNYNGEIPINRLDEIAQERTNSILFEIGARNDNLEDIDDGCEDGCEDDDYQFSDGEADDDIGF